LKHTIYEKGIFHTNHKCDHRYIQIFVNQDCTWYKL